MNYTHNTLTWLLQLFGSVINWVFSTELVNVNNVSISFGSAFVYFFIIYLVISLFLNAKVGAIGHYAKQRKSNEKTYYTDDILRNPGKYID